VLQPLSVITLIPLPLTSSLPLTYFRTIRKA